MRSSLYLFYAIIKSPLHEVQVGALRSSDAHIFDCSTVCLSSEMHAKNAVFSKTKQFRAMISINDQ